MFPLAPGLLSTTTGCFPRSASFGASAREDVDPGGGRERHDEHDGARREALRRGSGTDEYKQRRDNSHLKLHHKPWCRFAQRRSHHIEAASTTSAARSEERRVGT